MMVLHECVEYSFSTTKTYLHCRNVYGRETWQGGDLPWETPTHKVTWSRGLSGSCNNLKGVYLHNHNANGYQNWLGGDLDWAAPTHKVTWLTDHVVLLNHLTN